MDEYSSLLQIFVIAAVKSFITLAPGRFIGYSDPPTSVAEM